jgi:hypothetical protein
MKRIISVVCLLAVSAFAQEWAWPVLARQASRRGDGGSATMPSANTIVRWYKWDAATNSVGAYADYSPAGANFAFAGTGAYTPTWNGNALSMSGDFVRGANIVAASSVTYSIWFAPANTSQTGHVVSHDDYSYLRMTLVLIGGQYRFTHIADQHLYGNVTTNMTHALVSVASNKAVTAYINGSLALSYAGAYNVSVLHPTVLGAWARNYNYPYSGIIDDFVMWTNFVPTAQQALDIYQFPR